MSGQGEFDVADLAHSVEGIEKGFEGIRQIGHAADMGRDRRQDMVAGKERTGFGIVKTDVIRRVPGCVKHNPLSAGKLDDVAMLDMMGDGR